MYKINIKLFARLRELANTKDLTLKIEKAIPLTELFNILSNNFDSDFNEYFFEENTKTPKGIFTITLNRKKVIDFEKIVEPNDEIALLPPVSGGSYY